MPGLAANFINVETESGFPPPVGRNFTARVHAMATRMDATLQRPERTLWFPPGVYLLDAPFTFPAPVVLSFAPGARLTPAITRVGDHDLDMLEIHGTVDAPLEQIFSTSGRVIFVGSGTPRVYPEWWGAARDPTSPDSRADTVAIQAAFRAAVTDREAVLRDGSSPIEVCLFNDYQLDDTVTIAAPASAPLLRAVSIVGRLGRRVSGPSPTRRRPGALLDISRVLDVTIRDLSFDAGGAWESCLVVSCDVARDRRVHQVSLVNCSFRGARGAQVVVSDVATTPPTSGGLNTLVHECHFAVEESGHTDFERPPLDAPSERPVPVTGQFLSRAIGLSVRASFGAELGVDECEFNGFLRRGVHTVGGVRATVFGSTFRFRDRADNLFPNGAAISLDRAGMPLSRLPSLQAAGCLATTPSFLWVDAPSVGDWEKSPEALKQGVSVVLTGISHRVDASRGLGLYWPPSVVWRGERPLSQSNVPGNSTLELVGCGFEEPGNALPPTPASLRQKSERSDVRELARLGVLPRVPRVFVNSDLRWVRNVGTFGAQAAAPVIGTFDESSLTRAHSLGAGPPRMAIAEPRIFLLREWVRLNPSLRLLFAWADWSGAPILVE